MRIAAGVAAVLVVALALPVSVAAGPLDPPTSRLTVRLLERTTKKAGPLHLTVRYVATQDSGAIVSVGFRRGRNGARHVLDGRKSWHVEARRGGFYPVVVRDGAQQLPPCPAEVLCSSPAVPGDWATLTYTPTDPELSFYLFVRDVPELTFEVNPGWTIREVRGGALWQLRDRSTSARLSAYNRQYMVEDFRGVSAPRAGGPSVAFASIPCWFPPLPGGDGSAYLKNGVSTAGTWREMDCRTYRAGAWGGSDTPTTWHNDGASLGWSGGQVMRLVVAVLPTAR